MTPSYFSEKYGILEAIVYLSTIDGDERLPTDPSLIYRQFCDAIYEYMTGEKSESNPPGIYSSFKREDGTIQKQWNPDSTLEFRMWHYILPILEKTNGKISPRVKQALINGLKVDLTSNEWSEVVYDYGFQRIFYSTILGASMRPTNLPTDTRERVINEVLPNLSPQEREDVEGIGRLLRQYIVKYDIW